MHSERTQQHVRAPVAALPPEVQPGDRIVLFDAVCKLCNGWSRFLIRFDKTRRFRLCSVQSPQGQQILRHFGYSTERFDTMLYVESGRCVEKSDAFFAIIGGLGFPWSGLMLFKLIPKRFRDPFYDTVAMNRYRWFGRYTQCVLPTADHLGRFLDKE